MYYKTLNITTIEEEKKYLRKTNDKNLRMYRLETFEGFVEHWGVKYFFNPDFKWDLPSICDKLPGLSSLLDHTAAFVDKDGNCFYFCSRMAATRKHFVQTTILQNMYHTIMMHITTAKLIV